MDLCTLSQYSTGYTNGKCGHDVRNHSQIRKILINKEGRQLVW